MVDHPHLVIPSTDPKTIIVMIFVVITAMLLAHKDSKGMNENFMLWIHLNDIILHDIIIQQYLLTYVRCTLQSMPTILALSKVLKAQVPTAGAIHLASRWAFSQSNLPTVMVRNLN